MDCSGVNISEARVGISGTTAKSRKRKFVPSSNPRPFAEVASSWKSQTKVDTLASFSFCIRMSQLCKIPAMLFHVDIIYLAKKAKRVRFGYGSRLKAKLFLPSHLACFARYTYLHGIALPDFYIVSSF